MLVFIKRIFLFLVVNCLVMFTVSILLNFFHVTPYLNRYGINYNSLLVFCLIWGMAGAFISLMLSKQMAKWMMGVKIVQKRDSTQAKELIEMVEELCRKAQLSHVPEVGIYASPVINAFATGPSKSSSLVAVSQGLLDKLDRNQIRAILGHELSHIASGDMVTMTLLQGVVNAFVMFLARIAAFALSGLGNSREKSGSSYMGYYFTVMFFEVIFMLLGSIVVASFSRYREYKADKGGAMLCSKQDMIHALEALKREHYRSTKKTKSIEAFMINSNTKNGLLRLFASHPPLEERIARLQY